MSTLRCVEYVWLDGNETPGLRSKTRILDTSVDVLKEPTFPTGLPDWGFDGSSTRQAPGDESDRLLRPVRVINDPMRNEGDVVALCEVMTPARQPHESCRRALLRDTLAAGAGAHEPWFGVEQEYTLTQGGRPLGWPDGGFPGPQGPYYCGVGHRIAIGRAVAEQHMMMCMEADLLIFGINAEVMPGQWEFQIGPRGRAVEQESPDPLTVADHLWLARYLLLRIAESIEVGVSFDPRPVEGDWNGAGMHTNFSTRGIRNEEQGRRMIDKAVSLLGLAHPEHVSEYGEGIAGRLTGEHETCQLDDFRAAPGDRGASVRIPAHVEEAGHGYIEDRRPNANADPYRVFDRILRTVCVS